jgi:peptide/nickel transport system substrate-binding protein
MVSKDLPFRLWSAVVLLFALALAACGGAAPSAPAASNPQSSSPITISLIADPPSLDPAFSSALVDRQVHNTDYGIKI